MSIFKSIYSGPRTSFSSGGSGKGMTENEQRRFGITENLLKTKVPTHYGKGEHKVKLAYITEPEAAILKKLDLYDSNPPHKGPGGIPNYNDSGGSGTGMGGMGSPGGGGSLGDRIASRKRAGTFNATTPTAASTAAKAAAQAAAQKAAVDRANATREKSRAAAENKKIADEIKAKKKAALIEKYSAPEESLFDKLKSYQKFKLGPFGVEIDEDGLTAEYGDFEANVSPDGFGLGYSFADGGRIGFEDGSQDPFYTDGNQRLEDLSYSELQELAENMMLMEYDNPVLLDERKREYFRNKYPMNVMGERSTKGIMDEKLLNRLENSRDFKNYIDI